MPPYQLQHRVLGENGMLIAAANTLTGCTKSHKLQEQGWVSVGQDMCQDGFPPGENENTGLDSLLAVRWVWEVGSWTA